MKGLKKYIVYRITFVTGLVLLTFLFLHLFGNEGGFFSVNEVFFLVCLTRILPLTILLGSIDLIILAFKKEFTWMKALVFLAIQVIFFTSILVTVN